MELVHSFRDETALQKEKDCGNKFPQLECKTYGFDCSFKIVGGIEKVIREFREHTLQEHYIDYPEGVVMKFISRQYG